MFFQAYSKYKHNNKQKHVISNCHNQSYLLEPHPQQQKTFLRPVFSTTKY